MRSPSTRVLVLGGGAAGLAAAARLSRRVAVVLIEARERLGGRVDTRIDPALGVAVERGAEFVHGRPERTLALARRAHARLREVPDRHLRLVKGRLSDATRTFSAAQELLGLDGRDEEPFATVLRRARRERRFPPAAIDMAGEFVRGFYLADPSRASSLALADMTRALDQVGGDVAYRVDGGYARVLAPLRRQLERSGVDVRLSTVVDEIRWRRGTVDVRAAGAAGGRLPSLKGDRLIVTVPVPALGRLRFAPALAAHRRAATALTMGPLVKVLLRFRRAPWGSRRLAFLHVPGAPVPVLWTTAPAPSPVLVGWAGGPDGLRLAGKPRTTILRAAIASAARGLRRRPADLEAQLDSAIVADWTSDPFALGGYAVFPVGSAEARRALARSVEGTLFFAGEATAGGEAGTVEGALRSGERAAGEVIASL
ncbi:NAD(P)/FAD-dependent oxidoreductase [Anaeromyxobacter sp. Fw109-5]|uniref:flavin monoamine oxidase family protein n=1 Tax=Anaeromyxobacter sp. (strain Fw109-5) TaxID=404589 RepID=UPI0000ED8A12|nr:NAD(P)/FAD-dependent oxidoreductase [Anaeromyxobacter sp. Fw109-5]ABS27374.1 amine oxidase [Anaeromyxobacter sp. Fw109-5]